MQSKIPQSKIPQLFLTYKPGWPKYLWILSIHKMSKSMSAPVSYTVTVMHGHSQEQTLSRMDMFTNGQGHEWTRSQTYTVTNGHGHEWKRVYCQLRFLQI